MTWHSCGPVRLTGPDFHDGEAIPSRDANRGANVSPPLDWSDPPPGTRSVVLVMVGPDGGGPGEGFRHWGLCDIAGDRRMLPEGIGHGGNDFGHPRHDGPAPPEDAPPRHHLFRFGALDQEVPTQAPKRLVADLRAAAEPHLLGLADLRCTYVSRHHGDRAARADVATF